MWKSTTVKLSNGSLDGNHLLCAWTAKGCPLLLIRPIGEIYWISWVFSSPFVKRRHWLKDLYTLLHWFPDWFGQRRDKTHSHWKSMEVFLPLPFRLVFENLRLESSESHAVFVQCRFKGKRRRLESARKFFSKIETQTESFECQFEKFSHCPFSFADCLITNEETFKSLQLSRKWVFQICSQRTPRFPMSAQCSNAFTWQPAWHYSNDDYSSVMSFEEAWKTDTGGYREMMSLECDQ